MIKMSDDLETNTQKFNLTYRTINRLNIMTDSYNEVLTLGIKDISNVLNTNIISRIRIFCNDNDIECNVNHSIKQHDKKVKVVRVSIPYKKERFTVSQKMSPIHSVTLSTSLSFLDEELFISSFCNMKNLTHVNVLHVAKFLSKKYSHNEYSYVKYFFDKLLNAEYKHSEKSFRQKITYSVFGIKDVSLFDALLMNKKVDTYNSMYNDMHKLRIRYMKAKSKLSKIPSYANFRKFELLIIEYNKMISDISFKIATYENTNVDYQKELMESIKYLLVDANTNKQLALEILVKDAKYLKQNDKVTVLKASYKKQLQAVVDYRKNFKEYYIFKKVAAYRYKNSDNVICINGIKWTLKSPSGSLNSRTTLSSLQKAYNKVTFDRQKLTLSVNAGL